MTHTTVIKRPSAFVPIAMSLVALGVVLGHIILSGTARQADEGTAAHLWQLLMAAQIPIVGIFRDPLAPAESTVCAAGAGAASRRGARSTCASLLA